MLFYLRSDTRLKTKSKQDWEHFISMSVLYGRYLMDRIDFGALKIEFYRR